MPAGKDSSIWYEHKIFQNFANISYPLIPDMYTHVTCAYRGYETFGNFWKILRAY